MIGRSLHEIQAVASLPSHPHVVTLHRAWQQRGHFYIQMDLAENGSLGSILRQVCSSLCTTGWSELTLHDKRQYHCVQR